MRCRLFALVVFAATAATGCTTSAPGTSSQTFHSAAAWAGHALSGGDPFVGGGKRFPVVYLLHGHGGQETDWFTHSAAAEVANSLGLVVVTPDGASSWYINTPAERWEDYSWRSRSHLAGRYLPPYNTANIAIER